MSAVDKIREAIRRRKHNRERKRRLKQGSRAKREARAVRRLRRALKVTLLAISAPRTMYDAVTVANIPAGARAVAGYVNGRYLTYGSLVVGWPAARHVSIAVSSVVGADILDVETGDATNLDAPRWFREHKERRGFYTSASNANALVTVLARAGISRHEYILWTAHYTDERHICSAKTCGYAGDGADATQFTTHGETVDESAVKLSFWRKHSR